MQALLLAALLSAPTKDVRPAEIETPNGIAVEEEGLIELPASDGPAWKRFVLPEILAFLAKVKAAGAEGHHRLYGVVGACHISRDDDAISSFQFLGSRMGLDEASIDAMATGASYLPAVRESLLLLDRWVSEGAAPPPSRTVEEGESLLP